VGEDLEMVLWKGDCTYRDVQGIRGKKNKVFIKGGDISILKK
jgi:hypothetical protein